MRRLEDEIKGLREGRRFFEEASAEGRRDREQQGTADDPFGEIWKDPFSPIKRRTNRNRNRNRNRNMNRSHGTQDYDPGNAVCLESSTQYIPIGGGGGGGGLYASVGAGQGPQHKVVSPGLLKSGLFGLTAFEAGKTQSELANRKEEYLESFLRAFQENTAET